MIRRIGRWMAISLILLVTLTGCWSNSPVERRDLILMMGVAPAPHHQITIYFQVPTLAGLSSMTSGGASSGGGSGNKTSENIVGTGSTVGDAFVEAQGKTQKDLYLGQVQVVVLSTRLSAKQFDQADNWITRLGAFEKTADVVVTSSVEKMFSVQVPSGSLPSILLSEGFSCDKCTNINSKRTYWDLEKADYNRGISMWFPLVRPSGQKFRVDSVVIYRKNVPAVYLNSTAQTMVFGYLVGKTQKGYLSLNLDGQPVSIRSLRSSTHYSVTEKGNRLHIAVRLNITGELNEFTGETKPINLKKVEIDAQNKLSEEVLTLIRQFQAAGVDPVGFGKKWVWFHQQKFQHPGSWASAFSRADVTVQTRVHFHQVGDVT